MALTMDKDILTKLKIVMIGDSGVGKSSLILNFTTNNFHENMQNTIAVDYKVKYITLNGKRIKLGIWDTAGQERFRTLTPGYYRGTHGVILVYDVTNKDSFNKLEAWIDEVHVYCNSADVVQMIVGNKTDLTNREVSVTDGLLLARKYKTLFVECSAKTSDGVQYCFEELVQKVIDNPKLWRKHSPKKSYDNYNKISSENAALDVIDVKCELNQPPSSSYCSCSSF